MYIYDITIIGMGPAGCNLARIISKNKKVLILDKDIIPRDKPCGGILIDESKEYLKNLKMPEEVLSKPGLVDLVYWDWDNNLKIKRKENFINVLRKKFDYWLYNLIPKNVEKLYGTRLVSFEEKNDLIELTLQKGSKKEKVLTKYLVGADGALSFVRSKIGKPLKHYIALQDWVITDKMPEDIIFIYDEEFTKFYAWLIPKREYLIIGAALDLKETGTKFDIFKKKLQRLGYNIKETVKKEGHLLSKPDSTKDVILGKRHIFLVGEATGLMDNRAGEGISFALRSSQYLADAFNSRENVLEKYQENCKDLIKEFERKLKQGNVLFDPLKRKKFFESL